MDAFDSHPLRPRTVIQQKPRSQQLALSSCSESESDMHALVFLPGKARYWKARACKPSEVVRQKAPSERSAAHVQMCTSVSTCVPVCPHVHKLVSRSCFMPYLLCVPLFPSYYVVEGRFCPRRIISRANRAPVT